MKIPVSLIAGACIGAAATFLAMRASKPASEADTLIPDPPITRSESSEEDDLFADDHDRSESFGHPHGYTKMDMSDPLQRDLCISFWYLDMSTVVDNLELHTGHRFEKQVGKIYAGPAEILEEQAAFMRSFLDETKRIVSERDSSPKGDDK